MDEFVSLTEFAVVAEISSEVARRMVQRGLLHGAYVDTSGRYLVPRMYAENIRRSRQEEGTSARLRGIVGMMEMPGRTPAQAEEERKRILGDVR